TLLSATTPFRTYQSYPRTFQAPDGSVFMAGPDARMYSISTNSNGSVVDRGFRDGQYRGNGVSVMYDIGKILVAGGGPQANLADAMVIDINGTLPVVTRTTSMLTGRHEANATVLPNGQVLVTGGIASTNRNQIAQAVYSADTWNPATGRWTQGASAARIRVYHSISLLMPDGTVLTGGGGSPGPQTNLNAEIYYPEYLFAKDGSGNLAARPQILEAPTALSYGQRFVVRTPHSAEIASVSFIALGSVTHSWDMNQRFVPLSIAGRGNEQLELTAPTSGNIAPPGYYMLFLVDTNGVPSKAQIVRIG
ncbi:MAG: galactose oxidase early set domain-containing protein, partial [Meiothermus sp.]|nr:galactose oxidase early set domain-containing protein [Meiothermus sp.]